MQNDVVAHVVQSLEERIAFGVYRVGSRLPSVRAIAEELGASPSIVRQAIQEMVERGLLVHEPHRSPIIAALPEENIPPLPPPPERSVVFISYHSLADFNVMEIYQGAHAVLSAEQLRLTISVVGTGGVATEIGAAERRELLQAAADPDVAGVLLWHSAGENSRKEVEAVQAAGKPVIFVDRMPPEGVSADFVGVDNYGAAVTVVRHLLEQGYRRILHLTYAEQTSPVLHRREGWHLALQEVGIIPESDWAIPVVYRADAYGAGFYEPPLGTLLREWWQRTPDPAAVFVVNDYLALMVLQAARGERLRVPEDIAIAGFDGSASQMEPDPIAGHDDAARLTSVVQPFREIGREAALILLERLAAIEHGEAAEDPRHLLLDGSLLIRASSVRS